MRRESGGDGAGHSFNRLDGGAFLVQPIQEAFDVVFPARHCVGGDCGFAGRFREVEIYVERRINRQQAFDRFVVKHFQDGDGFLERRHFFRGLDLRRPCLCDVVFLRVCGLAVSFFVDLIFDPPSFSAFVECH